MKTYKPNLFFCKYMSPVWDFAFSKGGIADIR